MPRVKKTDTAAAPAVRKKRGRPTNAAIAARKKTAGRKKTAARKKVAATGDDRYKLQVAELKAQVKELTAELKAVTKREQALLKMSERKEAAVAKFAAKWEKDELAKISATPVRRKRRARRKVSADATTVAE